MKKNKEKKWTDTERLDWLIENKKGIVPIEGEALRTMNRINWWYVLGTDFFENSLRAVIDNELNLKHGDR